MRDDVAQALKTGPTPTDDGGFAAEYLFLPDMPVFQGHFPGNPIVPGVMQLEMVRHCYERLTGDSVHIRRVVKAKYSGKALPGVFIDLQVSLTTQSDGTLIKATLTSADGPIATIRMVVA